MLEALQIVLGFAITIGLLVTVHEFGHYWVARRLGVKILRFSVGFGKPLWSRRFGADRTEFVLAAVPLGGYVKMLGEGEADYTPEEAHRAFDHQPLRARAAIVAAGPLFNFGFAILAYALMYMSGVPGLRPIVGEVTPGGLAERAGLQPRQEIVAVDDRPTPRWESVIQATLVAVLDQARAHYSVRESDGKMYDAYLDVRGVSVDEFGKGDFFGQLGMERYIPPVPAIIAEVVADSPAERGGLRPGDEILEVDGQPVANWDDWAGYVGQHPQQPIQARVRRAEQEVDLALVPQAKDGRGYVGVSAVAPEVWPPPEYVSYEQYGPLSALWQGMRKTWDMAVLSLRMLGKMLVMQVSVENLSGPISIAHYAGISFGTGLWAFLSFLGLVSLSLGIINLLPVPVLDGGHLLIYLLEWFKGKPLSERAIGVMQRVGLALLLFLMGLAFYNDLNRLWG